MIRYMNTYGIYNIKLIFAKPISNRAISRYSDVIDAILHTHHRFNFT